MNEHSPHIVQERPPSNASFDQAPTSIATQKSVIKILGIGREVESNEPYAIVSEIFQGQERIHALSPRYVREIIRVTTASINNVRGFKFPKRSNSESHPYAKLIASQTEYLQRLTNISCMLDNAEKHPTGNNYSITTDAIRRQVILLQSGFLPRRLGYR
jgi:hypothetical protein